MFYISPRDASRAPFDLSERQRRAIDADEGFRQFRFHRHRNAVALARLVDRIEAQRSNGLAWDLVLLEKLDDGYRARRSQHLREIIGLKIGVHHNGYRH